MDNKLKVREMEKPKNAGSKRRKREKAKWIKNMNLKTITFYLYKFLQEGGTGIFMYFFFFVVLVVL